MIGLPGAGKSVVARLLAERLQVSAVDLDATVEAEEGATIAELFERRGEAHFRARETQALERALADGAGVIACGGGVVIDPKNRAMLERCHTVWLEVEPETAAERMGALAGTRPLLAAGLPATRIATLLAERRALYEAAARARVRTTGRDASEVAEAVLATLDGAPR